MGFRKRHDSIVTQSRVHSWMANQRTRDRMNDHVGVREIIFACQTAAQFRGSGNVRFAANGQLSAIAQALMHSRRDSAAHAAQGDSREGGDGILRLSWRSSGAVG